MPHAVGRLIPLSLVLVAALAAVLSGVAGGAAPVGPAPAEPAPERRGGAADPAQPGNATIDAVSFAGDAATNTSDGRRVIWQRAAFDATVRYKPPDRSSYAVCMWTDDVATEVCKDVDLGDPQNRTSVTFELSEWPRESKGPQNLSVELRDGDRTLAEHTRGLIVLERNASYDGDSLSNSRELDMNTSALTADTDTDGINDGVELRTYNTDPTDSDSDNDGLRDGREIEVGTEPTDSDSDNDGLRDGREIEVGTEPNDPDSDNDGLQDGRELEIGTEPNDPDSDNDGLDDERELEVGTEPIDPDSDNDGLQDGRELEIGTDPTDADTDGDGLSDGTEVALGTDPTSGTTPFTLATGLVVTGAVVGLFTVRRVDGLDVEWEASDRIPLAVPSLIRQDDSEASDDRAGDVSRGSAEMVQSEDAWPNITEQPINPDRETVLSMLQDNDGRIRQSDIVEETDWSASKVSRTLSDMEDDDQVSKVTIGRENIITLYGEEPSTTMPGEDARTTTSGRGSGTKPARGERGVPTTDNDRDATAGEHGSDATDAEEDG